MRCSGENGSLEEIHEFPGACHKRFRTEAQAQAFIEDWKESYADVWRSEVKKALERGFQPKDTKFGVENILQEPTGGIADLMEHFNRAAEKVSIEPVLNLTMALACFFHGVRLSACVRRLKYAPNF